MDNKVIKDETWIDAVKVAKNNFFYKFFAIFIMGISIVICSTITLGSFNYSRMQDYFLTLSTTGFLIFIVYFIYLIMISFDPNQLTKIENKILDNFNKNFTNTSVSPSTQTVQPEGFDTSTFGSNSNIRSRDENEKIGTFLRKYSNMENYIIKIHKNISHSELSSFNKALNELFVFGIFSLEEINAINQIRIFRNALVHRSPEQEVKPNLLQHYDKCLDKVVSKIDKSKN